MPCPRVEAPRGHISACCAYRLLSDGVKASTLKAKAKAWTFQTKAKVFKHTARTEIKIRSTFDSLTG